MYRNFQDKILGSSIPIHPDLDVKFEGDLIRFNAENRKVMAHSMTNTMAVNLAWSIFGIPHPPTITLSSSVDA